MKTQGEFIELPEYLSEIRIVWSMKMIFERINSFVEAVKLKFMGAV